MTNCNHLDCCPECAGRLREAEKLAGLDGPERDNKKMRFGYQRLKGMKDGQPKDWLRQPWNTHHWVDMYVESCRTSPYLMGHVWAIYFPASIVAMVWLSL